MSGEQAREPYEELAVPVPGGDLAVLRWPSRAAAAPTVLALHGITANALAWSEVARRLEGRVTLLAPDLRGRGVSRRVGGPFGLARHADDAALLIELLGAGGPLTVVGHSMGAWIAALAAVRHPALIERLVLVDGGLGVPLPAGADERDALGAVLGPALARLSMTFADRAAYHAFWRAHPAIGGIWSPELARYVERDLTGSEPELRSACVLEAVRTDGAQVLLDREAAAAIRRLPCPGELVWAERGLLDEPQGLYDEQRLAAAALDGERLTIRAVPDTNHYSILMGGPGASVVADRVLAAAGF